MICPFLANNKDSLNNPCNFIKKVDIFHILVDSRRNLNKGGGMKKTYIVSLLLLSIFLIASSGVALADFCSDYQMYECSRIETQYGEITYTATECMELCYDFGFEVYIEGFCFNGFLYPATDSRHLLGTTNTCAGWAGTSVEFKGRSIIVNLTGIQADNGYAEIYKCTPCTNCCGG